MVPQPFRLAQMRLDLVNQFARLVVGPAFDHPRGWYRGKLRAQVGALMSFTTDAEREYLSRVALARDVRPQCLN